MGVVEVEVKETVAVLTEVAVALEVTVETADVAAEAIGGIAAEEKVVDVDAADSAATVGVAMEPNRQAALTPH